MRDNKLRFSVEMDRDNEMMHFDLDNNQKNSRDELEILRSEVNEYLDNLENKIK